MSREDFYDSLPVFSRFSELTNAGYYRRVPPDWWIVVADIAGSTAAIESGRYRDVNTVGAACIVAAQNAMEKKDFPFVFGGDGATMLVPPARFPRVAAALDGVRTLAKQNFDMTLRIGAVSAADLQSGVVEISRFRDLPTIELAKFRLAAERTMCLFRGGGISRAEEKIKADSESFEVAAGVGGTGDLTGLSCRWKPIPSSRGRILSLLVSAISERPDDTYAVVIRKLEAIFDGDIARANPVQVSKMAYKSIREALKDERRYHARTLSRSFFTRVLEIIFSVLVFRYRVPALVFDASRYVDAIGAHSDFRKFDDQLRLVLDCSDSQADEIRTFLENLHQRGEICYGLHESGEALMTCFVYGVDDGKHIHFVDGGDGGYAMAAKQYKEQLKSL